MKVTNFGPDGIPIALGGWSTGVTSINSNAIVGDGGPNATNFVQLITADTSNTMLDPIVNFASGSNIVFSFTSNTIRIASTAGGGGGGSALEILDEGVSLDTAVTSIDVVGAGITATNVGHAATLTIPPQDVGIEVVIGDGVSAMATGSKGYIEVPFGCTVTANRLQADVSGSVVVDVKKATYAGLPTTASICASAKPTLATAQKSEDTTLTGWTTAVAAGDWLEINVDSVTTIKRVTLSLTVRRT